MKNCSRCSEELTAENAYYKNKAKTRFQGYCKSCLYFRQKERWIKRKIEAIQYKGGKCQDCKILYPYPVMEFHHLDPKEKDFDWNDLRHHGSIKLIEKELDKCALLCSNCHRMRHHSDEQLKQDTKSSSIKKKYFCVDCNNEITKGSRKCANCHLAYKAKLDKEKILNRKKYFCSCGTELSNSKSKQCKQCLLKQINSKPRMWSKIKWPSNEEMEKLVWLHTMLELSKILGVSDRAISKHCKKRDIKLPPIGHWIINPTNPSA